MVIDYTPASKPLLYTPGRGGAVEEGMVSGGAQASGFDPRRVGWERREWVLSQYIHMDERHAPFGFIFYLTFYGRLHPTRAAQMHTSYNHAYSLLIFSSQLHTIPDLPSYNKYK